MRFRGKKTVFSPFYSVILCIFAVVSNVRKLNIEVYITDADWLHT